jgi:glutathionyl-hydroquinone reductase
MGMLVDGEWYDVWYPTDEHRGRFIRSAAQFRNWVTADGAAGPSGRGGFEAAAGRYHLYVSYACPWANRTLIFQPQRRGAPRAGDRFRRGPPAGGHAGIVLHHEITNLLAKQ